MDKVTFVTVKDLDTEELIEHAIIDRGNGEFSSMRKSTYDELKAETKAPKVVDEAAPE
jgi:hypothetical protein